MEMKTCSETMKMIGQVDSACGAALFEVGGIIITLPFFVPFFPCFFQQTKQRHNPQEERNWKERKSEKSRKKP